MSEARISHIASIELDGVPPRAIKLEFAREDGTHLIISMAAKVAAQLEAGLLRIPLADRKHIDANFALAS